ncbi:hypothetical protein M5K25_007309 [Dendrobium thyrsiflorum]|uniref:Uncharacterized protein n=1 Tax=Dendrobium thyrsiflorum TaxID=117978 RepID=A0ABD0VE69_DENTH
MATVLQAATLLMGWQIDIKRFRLRSALRSAPVRHKGFFVVRTDGRLSAISGVMPRRAKLIQNAVAVTGSSAGSKPGHELLLFEALREGLEEEMERDPEFVSWVKTLVTMVGHTR